MGEEQGSSIFLTLSYTSGLLSRESNTTYRYNIHSLSSDQYYRTFGTVVSTLYHVILYISIEQTIIHDTI